MFILRNYRALLSCLCLPIINVFGADCSVKNVSTLFNGNQQYLAIQVNNPEDLDHLTLYSTNPAIPYSVEISANEDTQPYGGIFRYLLHFSNRFR